ncbi:MAG: 6-phosphofructokinase [Clostridia bacterium]|nr:6-phosphofructokinase [Clostridia bacterium]
MNIKKIGIFTSGGDAPGMNAVTRSVTRYAISKGINVIGIRRGYMGLRTGDAFEMNLRTVSDVIHRGGTILYSSRDPEFQTEEGLESAVKFCKESSLDALVVIGGNGTLAGAKTLADKGVNCIFIPATIDNDVACSDYSIGYDTAMNTATEMVDKIRDTAQSHEKCSVVEVMGRHCGDIALRTGIAVGATAILIPEKPWDLENDIIKRIEYTQKIGKRHFIVIVAEGTGKAQEIAEKIKEKTKIDARWTVLGHVQRGGSPTLRDRVIASNMGCHAVDLILRNQKNRTVALACNKIVDYSIDDSLKFKKFFDEDLYENALKISI